MLSSFSYLRAVAAKQNTTRKQSRGVSWLQPFYVLPQAPRGVAVMPRADRGVEEEVEEEDERKTEARSAAMSATDTNNDPATAATARLPPMELSRA